MKTLILLILVAPILAQDFVSQIMEHNPFDPTRGYKDPELADNIAPIVPLDLPVCDGTLILGELRYALLTFMVEGIPVSKALEQNEQAHGYTIKTIEYDRITLVQGVKTHTIKLFFQDSKKEKRGGSRKAGARSRTKPGSKAKRPSVTKNKGKKNSKVDRKVTKKKPPKIIKKSNRNIKKRKPPKINF